jgi:hypothetical protein
MAHEWIRVQLLCAAALIFALPAMAKEQRARVLISQDWARLLQAAHAEAEAFRPASAASVAAARGEFAERLQALDAKLARCTVGSYWRRFLQWNRTSDALQSADTSPAELAIVLPYWEQAARSWDEPLLAATGAALRAWSAEMVRYNSGETAEQFRYRLAEMEVAWERWEKAEAEADWQILARLTNELHQRNQAAELVRFLRQQCSRPNLHLIANADWLERSTLRSIREVFPVYDQTERSVAQGAGLLTGEARLKLVPSAAGGHLAIVFNANAVSEVEGEVPGVRAGFVSRSSTIIEGHKPLELAGSGLLDGPALVDARTTVDCVSVNRGIGLIPRFAERGIYNGTADAEERASNRARRQTVERLNAVARELRQQMITQQDHPAVREFLAFSPGLSRQWQTSSDSLEGWLWRAGPQLFAGPNLPPAPSHNGAMLVQVHETYLDRAAQERWGGQQVSFEEIGERIRKALGREMEATQVEEGWSLATAAEPAHIRLHDNQATIKLRFEQFTSPTGEFPGLAISVRYRLETLNGELRLYREADIEVVPLEMDGKEGQLTGRMLVLTRIVRRNFDELLPKYVPIKEIQLAKRADGKELPPLRFSQSATERGWLTTVLDDQEFRSTTLPKRGKTR